MARSGKVRVEYKDLGLKKVFDAIARIGLVSLRVGVVGAKASQLTADGRLTNAENAVIQQYGLAPKHYTKRDFLNQPFKSERAKVAGILRRVMGRVVNLYETPEQAVDWAGYQLQKITRDAIMDPPGIGPLNAPATVEKKGFNHPLIDHLDLYDAISHRVVRESGDVIDAGGAVDAVESFEIGGG